MTEVFLYPRLPLRAARASLVAITGKRGSDLTLLSATSHPEAVFAATGGTRVTATYLQQFRERVVEAARRLGAPTSTRQDKVVAFDAEAGQILHDHLIITPGEASRDEWWSFLSIILLPDLATWRFPDQNERRFLGGVRNVFQRMWWRAYQLRDAENDDPWWLLKLPEDALVGLMERPGISSNKEVSMAIAKGIAEVANLGPAVREDAWRDAYKQIRQRFPLVNFDALPADEMLVQISGICRNAMATFKEN